MNKKVDNNSTEPVRIDTDCLGLVRSHKEATGFPIARFIEDAIIEKVERLSDEIKSKMGLHTKKK